MWKHMKCWLVRIGELFVDFVFAELGLVTECGNTASELGM